MVEHLQRKRTKITIGRSFVEVDRQMSRKRHEVDQLMALQKQQNERIDIIEGVSKVTDIVIYY